MNPNLTPTPRVDKTGRIVTRHMKTQSKGSNVLGSIPPAPSVQNQKARSLIRTAFKNAPEEMVDLMERLTTTGTETARTWALRPIAQYRLNQDLRGKFSRLVIDGDENPGELMVSMSEIWNAGNVAEETGRINEVDFTKEGSFTYLEHSYRETLNDGQWRAYAALRLIAEPLMEDGIDFHYDDTDEFINWAAERDDLDAVISFGRERRTTVPAAISELIKASATAALREGSL